MIRYKNIYDVGFTSGTGADLHRFRSVARDGFNALDSPDTRFFKLLFYFDNEAIDGTQNNNYLGTNPGLLSTDGMTALSDELYKYGSAFAYLKNNLETERANELVNFINLLKSISSESPWYFKEVSGIDEALKRENFKVDEERKKITITCLDDPIDHRISSLLSLYRSIVWSHARKCEVLPANLRKFDMGIYLFSSLTIGPHVFKGGEAGTTFDEQSWMDIKTAERSVVREGSLGYDADMLDHIKNPNYRGIASNKLIEFHNCEISLDSIISGFSSLSNEDGVKQEFKIDIYYDDCYENEFNQYILDNFGDFLLTDVSEAYYEGNFDEYYLSEVIMPDPPSPEDIKYVDSRVSPYKNNTSTETPVSWKERAVAQLASSIDNVEMEIKNSADKFKNVLKQSTNSVSNKLTGTSVYGLGNIYEDGIAANISRDINRQIQLLSNKALGNISRYTNIATDTVKGAIENPIKSIINKTSMYADNIIDSVDQNISEGITKNKTNSDLGKLYDEQSEELKKMEADRIAAYGTMEQTKNQKKLNTLGSLL